MSHVLNAVEIQKDWSESEFISNLISCFHGKIPDDICMN